MYANGINSLYAIKIKWIEGGDIYELRSYRNQTGSHRDPGQNW
jgi:hypothetical protein